MGKMSNLNSPLLDHTDYLNSRINTNSDASSYGNIYINDAGRYTKLNSNLNSNTRVVKSNLFNIQDMSENKNIKTSRNIKTNRNSSLMSNKKTGNKNYASILPGIKLKGKLLNAISIKENHIIK